MTIEQFEKASQLGTELLHLKYAIDLLTAPKLECKITIQATRKNAETYQQPMERVFKDDDIKEAFAKILQEKRDRLNKEFEEL